MDRFGLVITNLVLLAWVVLLTRDQRDTRNVIDELWELVARIADDLADREDDGK